MMRYRIGSVLILLMTLLSSCQFAGKLDEKQLHPYLTVCFTAFFLLSGLGLLFYKMGKKSGFFDDSESLITIPVRIHTLRYLMVIIGFLSFLTLVSSGWFIYFYYAIIHQDWNAGGNKSTLYALFNIAGENTISSWFASMIFMLTGLIVLLLFYYHHKLAQSKTDRFTVWGWLLLSLFFIMLSADEMGSIHERLGLALADNKAIQPGSIIITAGLVFGGIAGIYMLWFFLRYFRAHLRTLVFLITGALCILPGILLEEGWDHQMHQLTETAANLKQIIGISLMEEGLELFFSWFMLLGFLLILLKISDSTKPLGKSSIRTLNIAINRRVVTGSIYLVLAAAVMGVGIVAPVLEFGIKGGDTGILRNWFPSALAFTAALVSWIKWSSTNKPERNKYLVLFGGLLALSIYHGANLRFWLSIIEHLPVSALPVYHLVLLSGMVSFMILYGYKGLRTWQGICFVLWIISLTASFMIVKQPATSIDIIPFAFLFPFLIAVLMQAGDKRV